MLPAQNSTAQHSTYHHAALLSGVRAPVPWPLLDRPGCFTGACRSELVKVCDDPQADGCTLLRATAALLSDRVSAGASPHTDSASAGGATEAAGRAAGGAAVGAAAGGASSEQGPALASGAGAAARQAASQPPATLPGTATAGVAIGPRPHSATRHRAVGLALIFASVGVLAVAAAGVAVWVVLARLREGQPPLPYSRVGTSADDHEGGLHSPQGRHWPLQAAAAPQGSASANSGGGGRTVGAVALELSSLPFKA